MWQVYIETLVLMFGLGVITWLYSLYRDDVSIVDSLWPVMFLAGSFYVLLAAPQVLARNWLVLAMVSVWAMRLSIFLTVRNWGQPEDRRYQQIRSNNSPHFGFKSLYIVFGLQAMIAWLVFFGLLPLLYKTAQFNLLDAIAIVMWFVGMVFESLADFQLHRFNRNPSNHGKVLDTGLWRYTRHPNYFGEFLVWWAFFLMAAGSGYWWCILSPVIMTALLLKVSGVGLMEKGMDGRRPGYQEYAERTNTFFPWHSKHLAAGRLEAVNHD